jgi:hypothetical protein
MATGKYAVEKLEELPGYWSGRAQTRRALAALEPVGFEQDRHLKMATIFEHEADNCRVLAACRSVSAPSRQLRGNCPA